MFFENFESKHVWTNLVAAQAYEEALVTTYLGLGEPRGRGANPMPGEAYWILPVALVWS